MGKVIKDIVLPIDKFQNFNPEMGAYFDFSTLLEHQTNNIVKDKANIGDTINKLHIKKSNPNDLFIQIHYKVITYEKIEYGYSL